MPTIRQFAVVLLVLATSALTLPATAGNNPCKGFYKRKKQSLSEEAWKRVEPRFQSVEAGMSQRQFFAALEAEVLALDEKPMDLRVDGYLRAAPELLPDAGTNVRTLLFGYKQKKHEVHKVLVVFRDDRLSEVVELETRVAELH